MEQALKNIKMIIMDNDGVLNDGKVYIDVSEKRTKKFSIRDGFAIKLASTQNILFAIISENVTEIMKIKAEELGINEVHQGENKLQIYEEIRMRYSLDDSEILFIGDDIVDIPVLIQAGVGATVKNAAIEAKTLSDYVTEHKGGAGAVREIIEMVLKAQGKWKQAIKNYLIEHNPGFNIENIQ